MTDYIKRSEALSLVHHSKFDTEDDKNYILLILGKEYGCQSADVEPVRHGHWVVIDAEEPRRYGCSECKRLSWNMENYCGNCGARMDGGNDE